MTKQARQTIESNVAGFGHSVDLNQDASWLAVGAPHRPRGSVLMYELFELRWKEKNRIQPIDATSRFGESVAVDRFATYVVVGDPGQEAIYIFIRQGIKFTLVRKITSPNAGSSTDFGMHVDIAYDAKTIVVGARRDDNGVAYIYRFDGEDWVDYTAVTPPDLTPGADFGNSVGISNDGRKVIVGAPDTTETEEFTITDDTVTPPPLPCPIPPCPPGPAPTVPVSWEYTGAAYLIELQNQTWTITRKAMNKTRPLPATQSELSAIPAHNRYDLDAGVRSRLGYAVCIAGDGGRVALGCAGNDPFGLYSHLTVNMGVNTWENPRLGFHALKVAMPNNGLEIIASRPNDARTFLRANALGTWFTFYQLQAAPGDKSFGKDVTFSGDSTTRFVGSE